MLRVRHERPEAATSLEVKAPVWLVVTEDSYLHATGFSMDGIRIVEATDITPSSADMVLPFQGFDVTVPVRFDEREGNFLPFANLNARTLAILRVFHEGLSSGRMVSAGDVITSLDTPVDLIPMGETESEKKKADGRSGSRVLRALWSVMFYLLLGTAVFMTIGDRIWTWLNTVPITHARIAAPIETRPASATGFVIDVPVEVGDQIRVGDLLASVSDPETGERIEGARAEIAFLERREEELERDIDVLEAPLRDRRAGLLGRLQATYDDRTLQDFLGYYDMEAVLVALNDLHSFDADPWRASPDGEAGHTALTVELSETAAALAELRRDLATLKSQAHRNDIVANFDGIVEEVFIRPGQIVFQGKPTVSIEIEEPRYVRGYVPVERAPLLFVGMPAEFTLQTPEGERIYPAYVAGFSDATGEQAKPELGQLVRLKAVDLGVTEARQSLVPGKPVGAMANRQVLSGVQRWWRANVLRD